MSHIQELRDVRVKLHGAEANTGPERTGQRAAPGEAAGMKVEVFDLIGHPKNAQGLRMGA